MSGRLVQIALLCMDRLSRALPWHRRGQQPVPDHLRTGQRGEEDAYFWLRRQGYTMVARNWRSRRHRGEIDLIGWDGGVLCFIEVKTRSARSLVPAEAAVDRSKQDNLRAVAREYLRRLHASPGCRFDVVSVYYEEGSAPDLTLFRNAFPLSVHARN